jgi:hypothetical protein
LSVHVGIIEHMFEDPAAEASGGSGAAGGAVDGALLGVAPARFGSPQQRIAWVLSRPPSGVTMSVLEDLVDVALPRAWRVLAAKAWDRQVASIAALAAAASSTGTGV